MRKSLIILILPFSSLAFLTSCSDIFTDKEYHIEGNLYVIYYAGDGCRLARKENNNNYSTDIIGSTLSQVYKKDDMLLVKAEPETLNADTLFYKVWYKIPDGRDSVSAITVTEFTSLTKGLIGIIPVGK